MTVRDLMDKLYKIANEHGWDNQVYVVDETGECGFAVHAEQEALGDPPRTVVYIDVTANPEESDGIPPVPRN